MEKQELDTHLLTFIFGADEPSRNIYNGKSYSYGLADPESFHAQSLLEFAQEKYPENPIFQQLNLNHTAVTIAYFFVQMGHVVFFNTSKNQKGKRKSGFIMMPDELTADQLETLTQLPNMIKEYSPFYITDGFCIQDGIINSNTCESTSRLHTQQLLTNYLEKKKEKTRRSKSVK